MHRVGDRVEIHPKYDLWMMGARCGTVRRVTRKGQVWVKLDNYDRKLWRGPPEDLTNYGKV